MISSDRLTPMTRAEAFDALRHSQYAIGRVGFVSTDGEPTILPVNFVLDGADIVLRTSEGSKLEVAVAGRRVAFETDWLGEPERDGRLHGWSVLVRGGASVVERPEDLSYLQLARLEPSAGGMKPWFVRISIDEISGRRF